MNRLGRTVALALPVLLLAACGEAASSPSSADDTTSPSPTTAASETPSETVTATPAPTATPSEDGPVVLSFNGLEEGPPPAMRYLRNDADTPGGWSLVESDGDVRRLNREYAQFAPMGDGLVGLADFSPSGERILAGPSYLDGFGQGIAAVLDRDGEVLAEWRSHGQATILGTVWEDDDHVLVTAFQDEHSAILRVGLDGSVEFALPPVRDENASGVYVLPVR